jgi:hypothetical protein
MKKVERCVYFMGNGKNVGKRKCKQVNMVSEEQRIRN